MQEHEYLPLIPKSERRQLQAVIRAAQTARGWAYSPPAFDTAWEEVLTAACTPEGGGWAHVFDPVQAMTPPSLSCLADLIDRLLLGGTLQAWLRQQGEWVGVCSPWVGSTREVCWCDGWHPTFVVLLLPWLRMAGGR